MVPSHGGGNVGNTAHAVTSMRLPKHPKLCKVPTPEGGTTTGGESSSSALNTLDGMLASQIQTFGA